MLSLNSDLPLRVFSWDGSAGHLLGETPAPDPGVAIPAGACVYVEPAQPDLGDTAIGPLAAELHKRNLPGLSLRGCAQISNTGLFQLALVLPGLRFLDLTHTHASPKGLSSFRDPSMLQTLIWQDLEAEQGELVPLSAQWGLRHLDLSRLRAPRQTRWDRLRGNVWQKPDLAELSSGIGLSSLRSLILKEIELGPEDVAALEKLAGLHRLDLTGAAGLTAEAVSRLRLLPALKELVLDGPPPDQGSTA